MSTAEDNFSLEDLSLEESFSVSWKSHALHLKGAVAQLLETRKFYDVLIYCDDTNKIEAHRLLLAACSGYFARLFETLPTPTIPIVIVLKGIKSETVDRVIQFIYRGEIDIEPDKIEEFLEATELLEIFALIEESNNNKVNDTAINTTEVASNPVSGVQSTPLLFKIDITSVRRLREIKRYRIEPVVSSQENLETGYLVTKKRTLKPSQLGDIREVVHECNENDESD